MRSLPKWIERFLRTICPQNVFDQVLGDLIELYHHDIKTMGKRKAKRRLVLTTFRFLRPGIILRNRVSIDLNATPMFQHYLKTTVRHFFKSKLNFTFKVAGLVMAL